LGICIAPTKRYRAVCYPGNTADSQPQWTFTYCYLSQLTASKRIVDSLAPLGLEPVTFGMQARRSDRSTKSHPIVVIIVATFFTEDVLYFEECLSKVWIIVMRTHWTTLKHTLYHTARCATSCHKSNTMKIPSSACKRVIPWRFQLSRPSCFTSIIVFVMFEACIHTTSIQDQATVIG
jgi:hypothetical protein